ncbi:MAG TPA: hypothetical protein P5014_01460 [Patescibacteria group bacterium]|jgi:hypothetical protein|nr:hypothetical protein [Patescibacteria group bacterium]
MKYGEARKLIFDNKEKEVILDLVKSAQEQISKIPKSFFQINASVLQAYDTQVKMLSAVADSEFVLNAFKAAQKQIEIFSSLNNNFLYTNRPIEYKAILPIKSNGEIEEVKELKAKIDSLEDKLKFYKSKENKFEIEITPTGEFFYKGKELCITTNSLAGKFFKCSLEDGNNFVSDHYRFNELKCDQIKNLKRDVNNKYLKKDGLKAIMHRSGDGAGYILTEIIELGSL